MSVGLYQHFNSDGHTEDDINIVPIEEVELTPTDKISLSAKRVRKGRFLVQGTLHSIPYGLNDNVRRVGNVSKQGPNNYSSAYLVQQTA